MNWISVEVKPPENTPLLVGKDWIVFAQTVLWCHRKGFYRLGESEIRQDYTHWCDLRTITPPVPR